LSPAELVVISRGLEEVEKAWVAAVVPVTEVVVSGSAAALASKACTQQR
jgi:hypothetical protein